MNHMFIAIDGDSVGSRLQQLILEEKLEELQSFSESIKDTMFRFVQCIEQHGGVVYMNGGDNILAECTRNCAQIVAECVHMENEKGLVNYSLAIAGNAQDTYIGLNYAKSSKLHYIEVVREDKEAIFSRFCP